MLNVLKQPGKYMTRVFVFVWLEYTLWAFADWLLLHNEMGGAMCRGPQCLGGWLMMGGVLDVCVFVSDYV